MTLDEAPRGPHRIAQNGQVVIPKDVLRLANLTPGDGVYLVVREGIVELLPVATLNEWIRRGRTGNLRTE
jgi:AbrB family looped-hinge helix DNA binding protein